MQGSLPTKSEIVLPRLIRDILVARGYSTDQALADFLSPDYEKHLHDPYLLTDMKPAVERICQAVNRQEKIIVYGDYDIDGITASAVMLETLRSLGAEAESYIPDRFEEGYGINLAALKKLKEQGTDLVITVDCGITSVKEVVWANKHGLDIVITDHHAVPPEIPTAIAVINPKRANDKYPFKDLAGVGVAFKLAQALQQATGKPEKGHEKWLLDLVALGTVCDVVTLVGENRVLTKYGLVVLNKTRRAGLKALAAVSGVEIGKISSYHLGFMFGPRMNAAGRLEHAAKSLELMLTEDEELAAKIAAELDFLNRQRQTDQARIFAEASTQAAEFADDPVLVLAHKDWSHGIVGIVASKLVERWRKPTLVMQIMGETTKGSARSLGSFNMVEALRGMEGLLIKCGGHHFAAGYTLKTSNIEALRRELNVYAKQQVIEDEDLAAKVEGRLESFGEVNWDLYGALCLLEPCGSGNAMPKFAASNLKVALINRVGADKKHLKLTLIDNDGRSMEAIGFGLSQRHENLRVGQNIDAVFQINRNDFNASSSLQLIINHIS